MDKFSEMELKYDAGWIKPNKIFELFTPQVLNSPISHTRSEHVAAIVGFKQVKGDDCFYTLNNKTVRLRIGEDGRSEITFKERKSDKSIKDRVEINVPIQDGTDSDVLFKFFECLDTKETLKLSKDSSIWHIKGSLREHGRYDTCKTINYNATIALYDVVDQTRCTPERRFLEVEIEASSGCTPDEADTILSVWNLILKHELRVDQPLNASLFEIYSEDS